MSFRKQIHALIEAGDRPALEALVCAESRALRHLVGVTYRDDPGARALAADLIGLAAEHHPKLVRELVERLLNALDQGSGTNASTVPAVLQAIADRRPRLLVGALPEILEAQQDSQLREPLAGVLETISRACPGEVSSRMGEAIQRLQGDPDADHHTGGSCCA